MASLLYRALAALLAFTVGSAGSSPASAQGDRDEQDWRAATAANTCEAYERYLELHPLGRYSGEAFQRAIECTLDSPAAGPTEDQNSVLGGAGAPY
jgi:hypothetical protein